MLSNIGIPGLIIILILALIVFGPNKLPEIGKAFGRSLREFKDATKDIASDSEDKGSHDARPQARTEETPSSHSSSTPSQK